MGVAVPVAFLLLATLLLWFLIYTKGSIWLKVGLTLFSGYFSLVLWSSLATFAGWATDKSLPDEFMLQWAMIVEPDKKTKDPGAIYVWIMGAESDAKNPLNLLGYESEHAEPRAFKLPYSRPMHEALEEALQALKKGKSVKGQKNGKFGGKGGQGDKEGQADGDGQNSSLSNQQDYVFHELLPPQPQQK